MIATRLKQDAVEDVTITRLNPGAWQDYKRLRLEALSTDPQAFEASYDDLVTKSETYWTERLQHAAGGNGSWLLFARREQRLVGMIGAVLAEERHMANLTAVFVTEEARGRGTGSELMRAILLELCQERSLQRLQLYVNAAQTAAVRLYSRFGFLIVRAERARYGDGQEHDGYVMERILV